MPLPGADLAVSPQPLPPQTQHYVVDVLRLRDGDAVLLFDGVGQERPAALRAGRDGWHAEPTGPVRTGRTAAPVTLVYGLPKGEKLDRVVRQATELGVAQILLVQMAHSVVQLTGARAAKRVERLQRIATEAARQAGRADVPQIQGPVSVPDAIASTADCAARWLLEPTGAVGVAQAPAQAPLAVWVGPEGGFKPTELDQAKAAGWAAVRLDTPVLRTETAAPVACALAMARLGWV